MNKWEQAIDDELICSWLGTTDSYEDPRKAIAAIIDWNVGVDRYFRNEPLSETDATKLCKEGTTPMELIRLVEKAHGIRPYVAQEDSSLPNWP